MEQHRLGKTDGLAHEPLQSGPEGEMFPLNLLRLCFANRMLFGPQITMVHLRTTSVELTHAERGEPGV
jgi:hypothetical protein